MRSMASSGALAGMVVLVVALMASPQAESALTCGQVFSGLTPCLNYLQKGGKLTQACCDGVHGLALGTSTTKDRQTACGCLKTVAAGVKGIYLDRAAALPQKCGVKVPYKISPSTDCSKVK